MQSCLSIFKKTKTITQHLSYDNMMKLTSLTMKAAAAAKKKTGQWYRSPKFYCIVLFLLAAWVFPLPAPLFYHFLTSNVIAMCASTTWLDHVFWCRFHLVSAKKGVPSSPMILVSSTMSTLTTTKLIIHESVDIVFVIIVDHEIAMSLQRVPKPRDWIMFFDVVFI